MVKNYIAPPYVDVTAGFEGWPEHLDYGTYFFGPNNEMKKFRKGEQNPFFSGTRNIVLYVHGRGSGGTRGRIVTKYRETLNWKMSQPRGPDVDLREAWAAKGWEVGMFYWDNFSDEEKHTYAEAKVWTSESPVGMSYISNDGTERQTKDAPKVSAADLFRESIEDIMSECKRNGVQLRIVGHSMGSQMAIRASYLLGRRVAKGLVPRSYLPTRIALVDPFWSSKFAEVNSPTWIGKQEFAHGEDSEPATTSSLSTSFATYLAERFGVLFEIYTSCPVLVENPVIADPSPATDLVARGYAAQVRLAPDFCPAWDVECRHLSAPFMYLWSMAFGLTPTSAMIGVPSASMPDKVLRQARGGIWEQGPGMVPCEVSSYTYRQLQPPRTQQGEEGEEEEKDDAKFRIPAFTELAKSYLPESIVLRFRRSLESTGNTGDA
jgi:pimeloyl-ACP methyl ester carboxylesterase